jgi:3-hexulose-6-phosphate synthase / 6-phospho-3-hexuloisomerase
MTVADDILKKLGALATPTIANALDDVAFEGVMAGLTQVVPGTRCVGRAVTVRQITGWRGDFGSDDFKVGHIIDAAGPGDILVIDNGGHCVSTFGGLATLAAKTKGIAGLVADGGVRDREEMVEHQFPVFARHVTPLTGRTRLALAAINEPVGCGGVRVRPGDVIVADGSGVMCIPADVAERVAELATRYAEDDRNAAAEIAKGLPFREAMAKYRRI